MYFLLLSFLALGITQSAAFNKTSKRGLTFPATDNPGDLMNINQTHSQISWVYDWGLEIPAYLKTSNIPYVPMQWGAGNIENLASTLQAQGSKIVLGFNEPDFDEQSNIDPTYAAQLWQKYMNPLKAQGITLGGPAVSSSGSGQPWLQQFFAACTGCIIDFLPLHWYGVGVGGFYDYIFQIHGQFPNTTIWITEYADTSLNDTEVITFLTQTSAYLDSLDWVDRYAWFGYFRPQNGSAYNFLDADGGLTDLGKAYIGAGTVFKSGPAASTTAAANPGGPPNTLQTLTVPTGTAPTFIPNAALAAQSYLSHSCLLYCLFVVLGSSSLLWSVL